MVLIIVIMPLQKAMQKSARPKPLVSSAGPRRPVQPRPVLKPRAPSAPAKRDTVIASGTSKNGLSMDQLLKQISCTNENILNDVIPNGNAKNRSQSSGALKNSGASKQPVQRQGAKIAQSTPVRPKTVTPKSVVPIRNSRALVKDVTSKPKIASLTTGQQSKKQPLEKAVSLPLDKNHKKSIMKDQESKKSTPTKYPEPKEKKAFSFLQGWFKSDSTEKSEPQLDSGSKVNGTISKSTYEINRLSTILEDESMTLINRTKDDMILPFPRPPTASTCCQSFQFAEVMTDWVPGRKEIIADQFPMFDAVSINLKEDAAKNRLVIKSRLGIRDQNKPDQMIQWKRGPILGRGAYGTVWCGLTITGEMIAVKQAEISSIDMQKAQREYEKIQQEIDLLKSLNHKNIVGYLGTSLDEKIVSIFMQFIPGGSLTCVLKKFGPLAEPVVANYTKQILEGVQYLHAKNVVHRDIKGNNIMLMPNAIIKLIDFGCAKQAINLTKSNEEILKSMKGTPYWMAPEVMNEVGHGKKSDIWSIGCTVFEISTSRPPWSHLNRYAALFAISNGTAPNPEMPEKFSNEAKEFLTKCIIRDPEKRPDASALLNSKFILQHCQQNGKRILDSRGMPSNSSRRQ